MFCAISRGQRLFASTASRALSTTSSRAPGRMQAFVTRTRKFHGSSVLLHDDCKKNGRDQLLKEKIDEFLDEVGDVDDYHPELLGSHPELNDILAANKAWVKRKSEENPDYFKKLGGKQMPRYLYIGCSDARVDPGRMMGLHQGALFVHRNVGNVVSATDLNLLTVVDFAVTHLKVPHIVVVGHYDCGAVRGSIARPEDGGLGLIENWLRNIRDVARLHRAELQAIDDPEMRQRRLVELNVVEQCLNIFKIGAVQRRRVKTYVKGDFSYSLPRIHGMVFDPANGILKKLPLDFKNEVAEYRELYDLYQLPEWAKRRDSFKDNQGGEFWDGKGDAKKK